jgi:membrane associated rhomboid family serine protease
MQASQQLNLPVPGRVLKTVLAALFVTWLVFALAITWGGVSDAFFLQFTGNTAAIAQGEIWRLFTAPILHMPTGSIGHILGTLIGLYFLGASLETTWGARRFGWFLLWSGVLSYTVQFAVSLLLPARIVGHLMAEYYFGATPVIYAIAIAWATSFRGQQVMLMFVMPVSARALIWITVGISLMVLIAGGQTPSGHVANFAGMGLGYLLGGTSPSPLKRLLLRYRLAKLERQLDSERRTRRSKGQRSGFKVITGGRDDDPKKHNHPRKNGMLH